jgi:hypothetical protein
MVSWSRFFILSEIRYIFLRLESPLYVRLISSKAFMRLLPLEVFSKLRQVKDLPNVSVRYSRNWRSNVVPPTFACACQHGQHCRAQKTYPFSNAGFIKLQRLDLHDLVRDYVTCSAAQVPNLCGYPWLSRSQLRVEFCPSGTYLEWVVVVEAGNGVFQRGNGSALGLINQEHLIGSTRQKARLHCCSACCLSCGMTPRGGKRQ